MEIDERVSILNSKKPFPKYTQNSLEEDFKLKFIYYSNKLEGSILSLIETKVILEGIMVENHSLNEHIIVKNLERVFNYLASVQKNGKELDFKELCILAEITNIDYIEEVDRLLDKVNFKDKLSWSEILNLCVKIHDSLLAINGHLARLLLNHVLIEFGYLPVIIKEYGDSLESIIGNSENENIDLYLELL